MDWTEWTALGLSVSLFVTNAYTYFKLRATISQSQSSLLIVIPRLRSWADQIQRWWTVFWTYFRGQVDSLIHEDVASETSLPVPVSSLSDDRQVVGEGEIAYGKLFDFQLSKPIDGAHLENVINVELPTNEKLHLNIQEDYGNKVKR